jgi:hypothetical protein
MRTLPLTVISAALAKIGKIKSNRSDSFLCMIYFGNEI